MCITFDRYYSMRWPYLWQPDLEHLVSRVISRRDTDAWCVNSLSLNVQPPANELYFHGVERLHLTQVSIMHGVVWWIVFWVIISPHSWFSVIWLAHHSNYLESHIPWHDTGVSQEMRTYLSQDMSVVYWHEEQVASILNRIRIKLIFPKTNEWKLIGEMVNRVCRLPNQWQSWPLTTGAVKIHHVEIQQEHHPNLYIYLPPLSCAVNNGQPKLFL